MVTVSICPVPQVRAALLVANLGDAIAQPRAGVSSGHWNVGWFQTLRIGSGAATAIMRFGRLGS